MADKFQAWWNGKATRLQKWAMVSLAVIVGMAVVGTIAG